MMDYARRIALAILVRPHTAPDDRHRRRRERSHQQDDPGAGGGRNVRRHRGVAAAAVPFSRANEYAGTRLASDRAGGAGGKFQALQVAATLATPRHARLRRGRSANEDQDRHGED